MFSMKANGIRDMAVLKCIILPIYMGKRILQERASIYLLKYI